MAATRFRVYIYNHFDFSLAVWEEEKWNSFIPVCLLVLNTSVSQVCAASAFQGLRCPARFGIFLAFSGTTASVSGVYKSWPNCREELFMAINEDLRASALDSKEYNEMQQQLVKIIAYVDSTRSHRLCCSDSVWEELPSYTQTNGDILAFYNTLWATVAHFGHQRCGVRLVCLW